MKFEYFTVEERSMGGSKKMFACKCNTEHGPVIIKAPTLEELEASFNYYNQE